MNDELRRIVSGGQTGVDRAALDVARERGIPCGGWCPQGRRAEDGTLPDRYPLEETPATDYAQRTEWNVRDSDGTLILTLGEPTGGTALTRDLAEKWQRPCLVVDLDADDAFAAETRDDVRRWLTDNRIAVLNVAGPRHSQQPRGYARATQFLNHLLDGREES